MGYFIAYRHTGADPQHLEQLLPLVRDTFAADGVESYCTYFDEASFQDKQLGPHEIMQHAFDKIDEIGGLFVLIDGEDKSEGQILEVGYCLAKAIPIIVAKRRTVTNTYLHKMTKRTFEYESMDELARGIQSICAEDGSRT